MNDGKYLITRMQDSIFSFLLRGGKAVEIHCDSQQQESLLGNVYVGRVKNIAKNIGAAFVEIAPGAVCHLALDDLKNPFYTKKGASRSLQAGDELLVQVSREGIKTKYPSVTTNVTLHGKYVLLTTGNTSVSVSAKLSKERRAELKELVSAWERETAGLQTETSATDADAGGQNSDGEGMAAAARPYGWLLRTNAGAAEDEEIKGELEALRRRYEALTAQARFRTCFSCLVKMPSSYLARLSNLYDSDAEIILTDDALLYKEAKEYLEVHQPADLPKLSFYEDRMVEMRKLYSLEHHLEQALREKVWLNSGGYLIIQPTEALTVIDVNTGKFEGGKRKEESFLRINLEAAGEIARQIRLRNISGIIVVDFINMERQESMDTLLSAFEAELRRDPVPTNLIDMTKLFLVEVTRKKKEKTLAQCCREAGYSMVSY